MRISLRLGQIFESEKKKRGLVSDISVATSIERHTVKSLLDNKVKYLSMDALNKLCNYLVNEKKMDPSTLPGALFGCDPEPFWELLADREQLEFVLGTRTSIEWPRAAYMMASDAHLQALMISALSRYDKGAKTVMIQDRDREPDSRRLLPRFHLVKAPPSGCQLKDSSKEWKEVCQEARVVFDRQLRLRTSTANILIGSVKVNPVVELTVATLFFAKPFKNQDRVLNPADRSCPIMFRYRDQDPQPPSCIGGMRLARNEDADQPGIYFESAGGEWRRCPWVDGERDAAFFFYALYPGDSQLNVACGGFSSQATNQLADKFEEIVSQLGNATYATDSLRVGLYVIEFTTTNAGDPTPHAKGVRSTATGTVEQCTYKVHTVPREALARRLETK